MHKRIRKFTVVFEEAEEGGYIVRVPALPGCMTQGNTFEEARRMARDAIKAYCASLKIHGEPVPQEGPEIIGTISIPLAA